jgi:hypothetical protein
MLSKRQQKKVDAKIRNDRNYDLDYWNCYKALLAEGYKDPFQEMDNQTCCGVEWVRNFIQSLQGQTKTYADGIAVTFE